MSKWAIIGGTGLTTLEGLDITQQQKFDTPYGETAGNVIQGQYHGKPMIFLARHGDKHTFPPHKINYRANLWSLKELEVKNIIAIVTVGSINEAMRPTDLVIPHQLIDYTWSREQTFFSDNLAEVTHIDFTQPYSDTVRTQLLAAARQVNCKVHFQGVYGATQGPRLETAAEINRMEKDGCDIVGMTGMPEATLARELDLHYAACAVVVNQAAGRGSARITMDDIKHHLSLGMQHVTQFLGEVMQVVKADN